MLFVDIDCKNIESWCDVFGSEFYPSLEWFVICLGTAHMLLKWSPI